MVSFLQLNLGGASDILGRNVSYLQALFHLPLFILRVNMQSFHDFTITHHSFRAYVRRIKCELISYSVLILSGDFEVHALHQVE